MKFLIKNRNSISGNIKVIQFGRSFLAETVRQIQTDYAEI